MSLVQLRLLPGIYSFLQDPTPSPSSTQSPLALVNNLFKQFQILIGYHPVSSSGEDIKQATSALLKNLQHTRLSPSKKNSQLDRLITSIERRAQEKGVAITKKDAARYLLQLCKNSTLQDKHGANITIAESDMEEHLHQHYGLPVTWKQLILEHSKLTLLASMASPIALISSRFLHGNPLFSLPEEEARAIEFLMQMYGKPNTLFEKTISTASAIVRYNHAAVVEEFWFRYVIQDLLLTKLSKKVFTLFHKQHWVDHTNYKIIKCLLSAGLFSAAHQINFLLPFATKADIRGQLVHTFVLGLVASIAKENTGKTASAIGIHCGYNTVNVCLTANLIY